MPLGGFYIATFPRIVFVLGDSTGFGGFLLAFWGLIGILRWVLQWGIVECVCIVYHCWRIHVFWLHSRLLIRQLGLDPVSEFLNLFLPLELFHRQQIILKKLIDHILAILWCQKVTDTWNHHRWLTCIDHNRKLLERFYLIRLGKELLKSLGILLVEDFRNILFGRLRNIPLTLLGCWQEWGIFFTIGTVRVEWDFVDHSWEGFLDIIERLFGEVLLRVLG